MANQPLAKLLCGQSHRLQHRHRLTAYELEGPVDELMTTEKRMVEGRGKPGNILR
ncbi:MAG: hypothetical protein Q9169_003082 [Polycauliona sp. 2 TL-2023]